MAKRTTAVVALAFVLAACGGTTAAATTTANTAASSTIHATWIRLQPKSSPPAGSDGVEAFDGATGQLILFGGHPNTGPLDANTWLWTGRSWRKLHPATHPPGVDGAVMAYDTNTRQLVLFGGQGRDGTISYRTTWLWNGATWKQAHSVLNPAARGYGAMAFDPKSHKLLLFGGVNSTSALNDTWTWTGSQWRPLHPKHSPPPSTGQALAYDPTNDGLLLFGGLIGTGGGFPFLGTWLWTGTDWVALSPSSSPPRRSVASLGWDPSGRVLVLFGGIGAQFARLLDTWIWTGSTWQVAEVKRSPERRAAGQQFAYDPNQRAFVLFGGFSGDGLPAYGDTWILKLLP
jgi:hypothetical protein